MNDIKEPSMEIKTNRIHWVLIYVENLLQGLKGLFKGIRGEGKRIIRIYLSELLVT